MQQTKMNFTRCIFNYFIIPNDDKWIFELKAKKEKFDKENKWIFDLIDKHNK